MKVHKLNGQTKDLKKRRELVKQTKNVLLNNPIAMVIHYKDGSSEVVGCNPKAILTTNQTSN